MKIPKTDEIFKRKFNKLKEIEEDFVSQQFSLKKSKFNIERILYSCEDGFIILRKYSLKNIENFKVINVENDVNSFLKNLPYKSKNGEGLNLNLYELLKHTIGIELRIGQTIGLGTESGGIKIGSYIEIDGFMILTRKYSELENLEETLIDIYKFLELDNIRETLNKKVKGLLLEIEDKNYLIGFKNLELEEKEKELKKGIENLEILSKYNSNEKEFEKTSFEKIPKPFNICVLGEVSDQSIIRKELNYFF